MTTSLSPTVARASGTLVVLSLAQFLIALDYSIVYVALPSVSSELHLQDATSQWVISAYAVFFAGFLMVGGRLADQLGSKNVFVAAVALFGIASAAGGLAHDGGLLLVSRAVQGLAAAMLQPSILGLLGATFPAGASRSRALAIWGAVGASGLAAGVILGGLLTSLSWRLTFFINVPLTIICAIGATLWFTHAHQAADVQRIPLLASILGTGAVLSLVIGLTLGAERGWKDHVTGIAFASAVAMTTMFVHHERTSQSVLIEPVLRRIRSLGVGAGATALYMASVGSEFYLVTLLLQSSKGYTPLAAGLAFLPLAILVTIGNMVAGRAVRRYSVSAVLIAGFCIALIGLGTLAFTLHGDSYVRDLLPGLIISGLGHGMIYTSMFIMGTRDAPPQLQGAAGAILTTSQYLSAGVTVAVLTLVLGVGPDNGSFRSAFLVTAAAAAAGILLVAFQRRHLNGQFDRTGDLRRVG